MKGKPIGTRWDDEFLKEFMKVKGISTHQKILNYLCDEWKRSVNTPAPLLVVEKPKKTEPMVETPSTPVNSLKIEPKVPFEKEKWFFAEKYTLMPLSSKPLIPALIPKWKADKIKSDTEIKKAWEKFQNEY